MMIKQKKKTRLIDIAQKLGVSKVAVAAALSSNTNGTVRVGEKMTEKIRKAALEMNYQPNINAKTLAGRASKVIGILIDTEAPFPRFKILAGIEREATLRGYHCMIGEAHDSLENLRHNYDIFMQHGVDGVICISHDYPGTGNEFRKLFSDILEKIVFIDAPNHPDASYINVDRVASTMQVVKHLYDQGARNIAFVRGENSWKTVIQHETGYRQAMKELGYAENEFHIFHVKSIGNKRGLGAEDVSKLIKEHIIPEKIDAVIGLNDLLCQAFLQALQNTGKQCPLDIRIAGYDNQDFSQYAIPSLTTVDENCALQSKMIIDLLLEKINYPEKETKGCFATVIPQLIIRNSTKMEVNNAKADFPLFNRGQL